MTEENKKTIFEEEIKCPHCKKMVVVRRIKKTIEEPVKGEYEEHTEIEKSKQARLK